MLVVANVGECSLRMVRVCYMRPMRHKQGSVPFPQQCSLSSLYEKKKSKHSLH